MKANLLPEAVCPDRPDPPFADLKLNAWAIDALEAAVVARCLVGAHPEWDPFVRGTVALAPLVPSYLYVRQVGRWISGLDEMQRRIQLEAALFGTGVALFAVTAVSLLGPLTRSLRATSPLLTNGLRWGADERPSSNPRPPGGPPVSLPTPSPPAPDPPTLAPSSGSVTPARVASGHEVMPISWELDAKGSSHGPHQPPTGHLSNSELRPREPAPRTLRMRNIGGFPRGQDIRRMR